MIRRVRVAVTVLAMVVGWSLGAQEPREAAASSPSFGPEPPSPPPRSLDWGVQRRLAEAAPGWRSFTEDHPGWQALFDPRTGLPERAFGPGIPVVAADARSPAVAAAALRLRDEILERFGLDPSAHELIGIQRPGPMWYVHFAQRLGAFRVWNAGLTLRIDALGRLVMWGGRLIDTAGLDPAPNLGPEIARERAVAHLTAQGYVWAGLPLTSVGVEPVVHVAETRESLVPTLAWLVRIDSDDPPAEWTVVVDAHGGAVVDFWNDLRHCPRGCRHAHPHGTDADRAEAAAEVSRYIAMVTGTVTGTTHDGLLPQQTPVVSSFDSINVVLNGATVTTDAVGNFTFNGGGATVPVSCSLDGPWISGTATSGMPASFSTTTGSGTLSVAFTDSNSTIGERDMVFFANRAHATLKLHAPNQALLDNQILGRANLTSGNCNAFYEPLNHRINFYALGGGCINTATSGTVVEHEYGHGITTVIFNAAGQSVPGHLGEGFSDCIAGSCEDTSIIGAGFQGTGSIIRNMANNCQYPASCGSEIHLRGLVIGGSYWSTRLLFAQALGAAGKAQMDQYLFQHFSAAPQDETISLLEMLLLNDNDGDLTNGTPNLGFFHQGFTVAHGVPFPLPLVSIVHEPLNDTLDQLQPYRVQAVANALAATSVTSVTLFWRPGSGTWQQIPMTVQGGSTYLGLIPVQPFGTTVHYYLQGVDGLGNVGRLPSTAPADWFSFGTRLYSSFVNDGFETGSGWTHAVVSPNPVLGSDDWQNIVHGNPSHVYDPPTAFQGQLTWGNDLVPASNWNGNYQDGIDNYLTSPLYNCTGRTGVRLRYRRWLTVEDGLYDQGRVLVRAAPAAFVQVWQNPVGTGTQDFVDTSWVEQVLEIGTIANNQPSVQIRFQLTSDAAKNFGGWNIDALSLESASTVPILTTSGSTTNGQPWNLSVNASPGTPFLVLADVAPPSPLFLPGVGTASLSPFSPTVIFPQLLGLLPTIIGPSGIETATIVLPSSPPQVIGVPIRFQAVVMPGFDPARAVISNVVTLTIQ